MELVPVPGFGFLSVNVSRAIEDEFEDYISLFNLTAEDIPPEIGDKIKVGGWLAKCDNISLSSSATLLSFHPGEASSNLVKR